MPLVREVEEYTETAGAESLEQGTGCRLRRLAGAQLLRSSCLSVSRQAVLTNM